ncbi:hypothetical protein ES703_125986 [subsurface metagenome]
MNTTGDYSRGCPPDPEHIESLLPFLLGTFPFLTMKLELQPFDSPFTLFNLFFLTFIGNQHRAASGAKVCYLVARLLNKVKVFVVKNFYGVGAG